MHPICASLSHSCCLTSPVSSCAVTNASRILSSSSAARLGIRDGGSARLQASLRAEEILNTWPEAQVGRILGDHGDERGWQHTARKTVQARLSGGIHTTSGRVDVIRRSSFTRSGLHIQRRSSKQAASAWKQKASAVLDFDGDDSDDEDSEREDTDILDMAEWIKNKPTGLGEGKLFDTSLDDRLLEEIQLNQQEQAAGKSVSKNETPTSTVKPTKKAGNDVPPGGVGVFVKNLPRKKNVERDMRAALRSVSGLLHVRPLVSGNAKTREPICKGLALLTFATLDDAEEFIERYNGESILFGKVDKQIVCELARSSNSYKQTSPGQSSDGPRLGAKDPYQDRIKENSAVKSAQPLQDQFNRFAAAVALADRKMAEEIIKEMRDGESAGIDPLDFWDDEEESTSAMDGFEESEQFIDDQLFHLQNSVTAARTLSEEIGSKIQRGQNWNQLPADPRGVEKQLEELYEEVGRMIEEGDQDIAREVIEANYEALLEQLEEGIRGVEQAAMLDILAQLYMDMGDFECAEVLLDQTKELLDGIHSPHPLLDNVLEHVGSMYTGMGKPEEAVPCYLRSLKIQEDVFGTDNPLLVRTILGLAKTFRDMDEGSKSIELYKRALVISESSRIPNNEAVIFILTHLGHTLLEEERLQDAETTLRRAVMVTQKAYGERDGRVGVATCALARAKSGQGQIDEAVRMYQRGLQIMEECPSFHPDDPVVETVRTDLAELLNVVGRDSEAQALWEENLRVKERTVGKSDVQLVPHLNNLATSYAHAQLFEKCEPLLRRSLKLMTIHFGPKAHQISVSLELLATSLHHLGRGFEAEPLAREALAIREAHYGPDHPSTGQACNCLAAVLHGLDKDSESEVYLRRVLKIQEKELGPDCPEIMLTLELLVMLLDKQGRQSELPPIIRRLQRLEAILTDDSQNED